MGGQPPQTVRPKAAPYAEVERGQNHRIWERTTYELAPEGQWVPKTHRITELATGMNFKDPTTGEWLSSKEEIDVLPDGKTIGAVLGNHQVFFPSDIYDGVIELVTPDGKHLRSRPMGLSYFDGSNSVLIGELTNSVGQLIAPNQIIYTNCFTDLAADLVLTYRKDGFEQDVIFREQPSAPAAFGLNNDTTRLELLTEFFGAPEPAQAAGRVNPRDNLSDTTLTFGSMTMARGKAFEIGGQQDENDAAVPVYKSWDHLQGRTFLIEEVSFPDVAPKLQNLPAPAQAVTKASLPGSILHQVSASRLLPPERFVQENPKPVHLAQNRFYHQSPGLMLDYNTVSSQSGYTFQADITYYVSGTVNLSGTTTIEGNTVIKCNTNSGALINILGTINCKTAPYRPAVITSSGDGTLGESVPNTGNSCSGTFNIDVYNDMDTDLTDVYIYDNNWNCIVCDDYLWAWYDNYYSFTATPGQDYSLDAYDANGNEYYMDFYPEQQDAEIDIYDQWDLNYSEWGGGICTPPAPTPTTAISLANGGALHDLRICNVNIGIASAGSYSVTNAQFVNCGAALQSQSTSLFAGNILMYNVSTGFCGQSFQATAQQLTCDQGTHVTANSSGTSALTLVNSLITGVADYGVVPVTTNTVVKLASSSGVYQVVGGGKHYLGTNSPYRDIGTTNIDPNLLNCLFGRTTYPPVAYTNVTFTNAQVFNPQAQRDTDIPDLGYHYDALDYSFGGCTANSNMTFTAGTTVGWFRTSSGWYHTGHAIHMGDRTIIAFNGTVASPDCWARLNTVQEQDVSAGYGPGGISAWTWPYATNAPQVQAHFTKFSEMAGDGGNHMRDDYGILNVQPAHCEFYSGYIGFYNALTYYTNCLFIRVNLTQSTSQSLSVLSYRNCTMAGGIFNCSHGGSQWPARVTDCAFDGTTISSDDPTGGNTNIVYYNFASLAEKVGEFIGFRKAS